MRPTIKVGLATKDQAEDISRVICDAIREVNAKDYPPAEIDRLLGNFTSAHVLNFLTQRMTFVAVLDDRIAGTGALQGSEVKSVFVSPDLHRLGIGTELVKAIETAAMSAGLQELAVSSSLSAVKFYTSLGFAEKRRRFFGQEETVEMVKALI
ncbi:GNAT family N-acetyltransferase [Tropicibacter sp. R16_0]|uniref:GNAT family N-acetyltransferase n=1 Tax=Tropicibacter sp. R16_0 TaxID=2821102 RepID=UPI001ADA3E3D|nr:GNAT family N-acetyltransferase [Tropicibacter sp. R16_0]MBO9452717.1 GNAT family N-acetyltransferase [Tropicibacter sp. R16_0]